MASDVDICNRALTKLGQARITSLSEASKAGRALNANYPMIKKAFLRRHVWTCSVKRATLAADAEEVDWGRARSFTLPADFIRLADDYPEDNSLSKDWEIEGNQIFTDDADPLYLRYVANISESLMDALCVEALACEIAFELCEVITESNTKKQSLKEDKKDAINEAKRANAIEKVASEPPEDPWITCRN